MKEIGWHTIVEIEWHSIQEITWHKITEIRQFATVVTTATLLEEFGASK